jgi:hypothetical protein
MKRKTLLFSLLSLFVLASCTKQGVDNTASAKTSKTVTVNNDGNANRDPGDECPGTEVPLLAGQFHDAGSVAVSDDGVTLTVTFNMANGWVLKKTHVYAGDCALVPVNPPGNPIPGKFPYNNLWSNATTATIQIPVGVIGLGNCGCIAAHAEVVKLNEAGQVIASESAWGQGTVINPQGSWGMKFDYCSCP